MAVVGRLPIEVERPEHRDSDGVERTAAREELDGPVEGLFGSGGRESDFGTEIVRCAADGTHELRTAAFDTSVERHRARLDEWGSQERDRDSARRHLPGRRPETPPLALATLGHPLHFVVEGSWPRPSFRPHGLEEVEEGLRNVFLRCGDEQL